MIIYKKHINDYIRCPYLFGKNILSSKQNTIKLNDMALGIKKHIIELALYEMSNSHKYSLVEYRTKFTNKYYSKPSQIDLVEKIVPKLNTVFEPFAKNSFVGYNVPIDISLPSTSVIFRDIIDFIMTDEEGNITVIEIENIEDFDQAKLRLKYWPQYFLPYSYLAQEFDKKITVNIIDPNNFNMIESTYSKDRFKDDLLQMTDIGKAMSSTSLVRSLHGCDECDKKENCL